MSPEARSRFIVAIAGFAAVQYERLNVGKLTNNQLQEYTNRCSILGLRHLVERGLHELVKREDALKEFGARRAYLMLSAIARATGELQPSFDYLDKARQSVEPTPEAFRLHLELDIREAPVRELLMNVPKGYALARITAAGLADYFLKDQANDAQLRLVYAAPVSGRQIVQLRLERNSALGTPTWVLPRIEVPQAKSVRGHIAVSADASWPFVARAVALLAPEAARQRQADAGRGAGDQREPAVEAEAVEDVHGSNCAVKTSLVSHCRQPRAARALLECGPFRGALQGPRGPRLGNLHCNGAHPHGLVPWVSSNEFPPVASRGFHRFRSSP